MAGSVAWFNCKRESNHQKTVTPNVDSSIVYDDCDNVDDDLSDNDGLLHESDQYQMKGGIMLIKRQKHRIIQSVRFNKNKDPENYCREQIMLYTPWRNEKMCSKFSTLTRIDLSMSKIS